MFALFPIKHVPRHPHDGSLNGLIKYCRRTKIRGSYYRLHHWTVFSFLVATGAGLVYVCAYKISGNPVDSWLTRLQVKLAEVLGGAEGDHDHTVPEDVLPCGHLESDLCARDETVLLDHRVNRLHPAVPEVNPEEGEMKGETSGERCVHKHTYAHARWYVWALWNASDSCWVVRLKN